MKEEVPPPLIDAHLKAVEEAVKDGVTVEANFGLDKTGIAGTSLDSIAASTTGTTAEKDNGECDCAINHSHLRMVFRTF